MCKKMISLVLCIILLLSFPMPASATEDKTVYDLEEYMSLTDQGTIFFDAIQAQKDGFPVNLVAEHQRRVSYMNSLVIEGITTIDNTYTARIYFSKTRSTSESSYVDTSVWGVTRIYLNVSDTQELVNNLPSTTFMNGAAFLGLLSNIGFPISTALLNISINTENIKQAAANGTGIIIAIHDDGTTSTPFVVITPR